MDAQTPEAAWRRYWVGALGSLVIIVAISVWRLVVGYKEGIDVLPIAAWSFGGVIGAALVAWALFAIPAQAFAHQVRIKSPKALMFFVVRRAKLDTAVTAVSDGHINIGFFSAVLADEDNLRIVSRKATLTIPWSRVVRVAAGTTTEFRVDYGCVDVAVRIGTGEAVLPLVGSEGPWTAVFMVRPSVTRRLTASLASFIP